MSRRLFKLVGWLLVCLVWFDCLVCFVCLFVRSVVHSFVRFCFLFVFCVFVCFCLFVFVFYCLLACFVFCLFVCVCCLFVSLFVCLFVCFWVAFLRIPHLVSAEVSAEHFVPAGRELHQIQTHSTKHIIIYTQCFKRNALHASKQASEQACKPTNTTELSETQKHRAKNKQESKQTNKQNKQTNATKTKNDI